MTGQQVKDAETRLSEMQETLRALQAEVDLLSEKTLVELTSIEPYAALSSHEIKNKLALLKTEEDELVKSGEALLITTNGCNGVQREHNKKLNNGLPILHKVPPKRDYGRYFCILAEKGGTSHGGLTEKLSPFFTPKNRR